MATLVRADLEYLNVVDDDAESYVDEDDVREVRLHHWINDTESIGAMEDNEAARADSPLLGFDHLAPMSANKVCHQTHNE